MARLAPLPVAAPEDFVALGGGRSALRRRRRWWFSRLPLTVYGYLTVEVLRVFLLSVLAVSLVYSVIVAYQTVRSGIQLSFIWPLLLRTFAYPLSLSIPVALLFGTTLVVSRLENDLEISALETHGISLWHVFSPVLGLASLLAFLSFYLNGWVVPELHYEKRNLQKYILKQLESMGSGVNRMLLLPDGEGTLWVGQYNGTDLRRVRVDLNPNRESSFLPAIREHLPDRLPNKVTIFASEGKIEIHPDQSAVVLHLRSVQVHVPQTVKGAAISNDVFHQVFTISDSVMIPLSFARKARGTQDRTLSSLLTHLAELREEARRLPSDKRIGAMSPESRKAERKRRDRLEENIAEAATEFHRRLAVTLSCLTFPLLGASVSLLLHRANRLVPFFAGNVAAIAVFYPLLMVAVILGERGFVPWLSLSLPNVLLLIAGIVLARKVLRR